MPTANMGYFLPCDFSFIPEPAFTKEVRVQIPIDEDLTEYSL
jgi:hypothetical protein